MMLKIIRCIDDLKTNGTPIHLQWIPAHTNIKGNEKADVAAKEATRWKKAKEGAKSGENEIPDIQQKDMH